MISKTKIAAVLGTAALLFTTATSALANDLSISGNGAGSDNHIKLDFSKALNLIQDNEANIRNHVSVNANSGNNSSSDNTGGNNSIDTGDVETNVEIHNSANANFASVGGCGDCHDDTSARISGNGVFSDNQIDVNHESEVNVIQENEANFDNQVEVNANSGGNEQSGNTSGNNNHGSDWWDNHDNHGWWKDHNDWWDNDSHDDWWQDKHDWNDNNWDWWNDDSWWHEDDGNNTISTGDVVTNVSISNFANLNSFDSSGWGW